jgi:hypothetical protein
MSDGYNLGQMGNLPPEIYQQQQELNRQQKMAAMLMQNTKQPQGQMIGNRYVAPSFLQNLVPLANMYVSSSLNKEGDEKALEIAKQLREGRLGTQQALTEAINSGDTKKALSIATADQYDVGKQFLPALIGATIPKIEGPTKEMQNYNFAKTPEGGNYKGTFNEYKNEMDEYQRKHLGILAGNQAQSRVPMGYRMKQDGTLEAIPGGPADQKAQTVNAGRDTVDTLITGLKDKYNFLKDSGGITSTSQGAMTNVPAYLSSSVLGQTLGKTFATENQSARNTIAQSRPLLLQAIARATGMSSKQMDSNTELQMYLKAATDPTLDYEANTFALNQLQTLYGLGGNAPTGGGGGGLPSASDIDAEIDRRNKGKK